MVKPKLLISACLEFDKVRYDGQSVPSSIIRDLTPFVEFVKVCPEYEIGLGVPREPIRIVKKENEYRLIQHNTNKDVTEDMLNFTRDYLKTMPEVDGFIFKSRSPTMGMKDIKVYSGMKGSPVIEKCNGFFAGEISKKYNGYPFEDENRLRNRWIREHFLTKLFLFADYREAEKADRLWEFHEKNKLLFEFYNPELAGSLDLNKDYFETIKKIMQKPPSKEGIYSFFSKLLGENRYLEKYRNNKISFETLKEMARALVNNKQILEQSFFNPYPEELLMEVEQPRDYWQ